MSTGTMTSKGQITVPKAVREELGLTPGTKVTFSRLPDGGYAMRPVTRRRRAAESAGALAHDGPAVSLAAMDEAVAQGASGR